MKTETWLPCLHCGNTLYKRVSEDKQGRGLTEYRACLYCNAYYEVLEDDDGDELPGYPPLP
jgi:hypothetical protein